MAGKRKAVKKRAPHKGLVAVGEPPTRIEFDYIKSSWFRVIHVSGAHGAVNGQNLLHVGVYSERRAIPTKTVHEIKDGVMTELMKLREGRTSFVREIECDLILDYRTARALHEWLGTQIQKMGENERLIAAGTVVSARG